MSNPTEHGGFSEPATESTDPVSYPNRDHQHGGMEAVGTMAQSLKIAIHAGMNWYLLTPGEQEALDMIAHKISRILSGADPHDPEHWTDLAGYAHAAMRGLDATTTKTQ